MAGFISCGQVGFSVFLIFIEVDKLRNCTERNN